MLPGAAARQCPAEARARERATVGAKDGVMSRVESDFRPGAALAVERNQKASDCSGGTCAWCIRERDRSA